MNFIVHTSHVFFFSLQSNFGSSAGTRFLIYGSLEKLPQHKKLFLAPAEGCNFRLHWLSLSASPMDHLGLVLFVLCHWQSLAVTDCHWQSLTVINVQWPSLNVAEFYRISLIFIDCQWRSVMISDDQWQSVTVSDGQISGISFNFLFLYLPFLFII